MFSVRYKMNHLCNDELISFCQGLVMVSKETLVLKLTRLFCCFAEPLSRH